MAMSLFGLSASSYFGERLREEFSNSARENLDDELVDDIMFIRNFKRTVL